MLSFITEDNINCSEDNKEEPSIWISNYWGSLVQSIWLQYNYFHKHLTNIILNHIKSSCTCGATRDYKASNSLQNLWFFFIRDINLNTSPVWNILDCVLVKYNYGEFLTKIKQNVNNWVISMWFEKSMISTPDVFFLQYITQRVSQFK